MSAHREEQEGEMEALSCIYHEEELKIISESPYCFEVKVSVEDSEEQGHRVDVIIKFTLPPTYPDVGPEVEVTIETGLEEEEEKKLEQTLAEQSEENLGTVMVYTLVCGVQDRISELLDALREERERRKREKEEEEKRLEELKYRGTIVTKESFYEWKVRFDEERRKASGKVKEITQTNRLTGRQMFERDASLALSDTKFLTEGDMESGQVEVDVDESLFQDIEDLDLEDL